MDVRVRVALSLVQEKGRWLVGKRAPGRVFAGLWEFPGGKLQSGETPSQAAVREMFEEAGLAVEPVGEAGLVQTAHDGRGVDLHVVCCRLQHPGADLPSVVPCDPAVTEFRWVGLDELGDLPMPPANAEILRLLERREHPER